MAIMFMFSVYTTMSEYIIAFKLVRGRQNVNKWDELTSLSVDLIYGIVFLSSELSWQENEAGVNVELALMFSPKVMGLP